MASIDERFTRVPLSLPLRERCLPFSCGEEDLDEFFAVDFANYTRQLFGKTYVFLDNDDPRNIACAFTVANASIFTNYLPNARRKKVGHDVPHEKRDLIYPAVLIGRLSVNSKYRHQHIGSQLMDYIKAWFTDEQNKTGCRYLVVDAYNKPQPLEYYQRNGFAFMFSTEEQEREYRKIKVDAPLDTRLMFFDLINIVEQ